MPPNRAQRSSGACLQCSRKKRKCDHKHPQCSQCLKRNVACQPQTFKAWSIPGSRGSRIQSAAQQSEGERSRNKSEREKDPVVSQSPSEPPVATPNAAIATPDVAIELPIHNRQMSLDRPSPTIALESGLFDDAAWFHELVDTPASHAQYSHIGSSTPVNVVERVETLPDQEEGSVISRLPSERPMTATSLGIDPLMDARQITLDQPSPRNPLQGGIFNDASWLEELPQVPLTPCSEALQVMQQGNQDTTSNYINNDAYDAATIKNLDTPFLYEPNTHTDLSVGVFDPGNMVSRVDNVWQPVASEVPAMLYCPMPWPADMLVSAPRRFLWQHFLHVTRNGFLCLDPKHFAHMQDFQDPFVVTLPRMALFDDDLRAAIFYFSAFQYQASTQDQKFLPLMRETAREASLAVVPHAMGLESNDEKLLAKITVGLFLHLYGPEQRETHLEVAWSLAGTFLSNLRQRKRVPSIPARLILALLRWSRIATLCSLRQARPEYWHNTYDMLEMDEEEIGQNFCADFQNWTSHPVLAFSPRLINPLLRLGQLLELQQSKWAATGQLELSDPNLNAQVEVVEASLRSARTRDFVTSHSRSADPIELGSLNESMHSAAVILLYARLKGMPSTATQIRHHVGIIVGKIGNIDQDSRTSYAIIFPLFTAGCEAVDSSMRAAIVRRLRVRKGLFYNRGDLIGALRQIWEIRDREPGLTWLEWLGKVDSRFRVWCLF